MTPLQITVNLEANPWTDVVGDMTGDLVRLGYAPNLTVKGDPGVVLMIRTDDNRLVIAHTTWRLFRAATRVFAATPSAQVMEAEDG